MSKRPRQEPESVAPDMLWKRSPLLEWIRTSPPEWAEDSIRSWDEAIEPRCGVFALQFLLKTRRAKRAIDVRQIVGQRAHYCGQSWISTVATNHDHGKMRSALQQVDSNPWYYFTSVEREQIRLVSFDGAEWYSDVGVHRAIIAKFLHAYFEAQTGFHPLLHNVPTLRHQVDHETLSSYLRLHELIEFLKLPIMLSVKAGSRIDASCTDLEDVFEAPRIHVADHRLTAGPVTQSRILTANAFRIYAAWVCATAGEVTRTDRVRYVFGRALSDRYDAFSLIIGADCEREQ